MTEDKPQVSKLPPLPEPASVELPRQAAKLRIEGLTPIGKATDPTPSMPPPDPKVRPPRT